MVTMRVAKGDRELITTGKSCASVAAMALCAFGLAQSALPPTPILVQPGQIKPAAPTFIQPVIKIGGRVIPTGPRIPYVHNGNSRRIGNLIFDSFEGNSTNGGNPDVPTD